MKYILGGLLFPGKGIDMVCVYCSSETSVANSRHQKRANHVWRRRKCGNCGAIFTTTEVVDDAQALSVNRLGHLEPFSRDNLFVTVYDSLKHRKSALDDAKALTATIMSNVYAIAEDATVERDAIVTVATAVLERFDSVAATHYRAFHPLA